VKALVLELVEGSTLAERIQEGPIPLEEALPISQRIAKALESGAPSGTDSQLSQSPTLTRHGTQVGVILGTAAYMSPEQAKGKRVDKRTDIWAFGAVVYEMLTGKRAFAGEDVSDTLAAVLRAEPDFDALPSETPGTVLRILQLCLTKDPNEWARDIGDVGLAMKGAFETRAEVASPPVGWRPSIAMAAAAALLLSVITGVSVWQVHPAPTAVEMVSNVPTASRICYSTRRM